MKKGREDMAWLDEMEKNEERIPPILHTGVEFIATDKLKRTYLYRFVGIQPGEPSGCRYIKLWNLTNNHETEVEIEWFRQRKIVIVQAEAEKGLTLEDILRKYFGFCGTVDDAEWDGAYGKMMDCLAALSDLTECSLGRLPDRLDEIEQKEW